MKTPKSDGHSRSASLEQGKNGEAVPTPGEVKAELQLRARGIEDWPRNLLLARLAELPTIQLHPSPAELVREERDG